MYTMMVIKKNMFLLITCSLTCVVLTITFGVSDKLKIAWSFRSGCSWYHGSRLFDSASTVQSGSIPLGGSGVP